MKYAVVIERAPHNYAAYVPDLQGCISTGDTLEEIERNFRAAIAFHLDGMREDGVPIPEPRATAVMVEVPSVAAPSP